MIIGFVSDIHEDAQALRAALRALERRGCDVVCCLGDILGFSLTFQEDAGRRDASACVAMVRDQCVAAVAGNHDLYATRRIPRYAAGFPYGSDWYDLDENTRTRRARGLLWRYEDSDVPQQLNARDRAFIESLPEVTSLEVDGMRILLSHFRYPDLTGSLVRSLRDDHVERHLAFIQARGCQLGFSGHGHPEGFARAEGGRLVFDGFGSHVLHRRSQWIVGPGVARSDRASGVLAFDTRSFDLEVIPLHVP